MKYTVTEFPIWQINLKLNCAILTDARRRLSSHFVQCSIHISLYPLFNYCNDVILTPFSAQLISRVHFFFCWDDKWHDLFDGAAHSQLQFLFENWAVYSSLKNMLDLFPTLLLLFTHFPLFIYGGLATMWSLIIKNGLVSSKYLIKNVLGEHQSHLALDISRYNKLHR